MPLNEAAGYRRSNLTTQQKREAEAAIYGLTPNNMDINQFTSEDIERMRALIAQHDQSTGKIKSFDLNNPPQEPYAYQPFPKVLYNHASGKTYTVHSEDEMELLLAKGWKREAFPPVQEPEADLDPVSAAEVAEFDKALKAPKKK